MKSYAPAKASPQPAPAQAPASPTAHDNGAAASNLSGAPDEGELGPVLDAVSAAGPGGSGLGGGDSWDADLLGAPPGADLVPSLDSHLDEAPPLADVEATTQALAQVVRLGRVIDAILDNRAVALQRLEADTEPSPVEDDGLVVACAAAALGAATAGIGGVVGASLAAKVAAPMAEFCKSAVKDVVDDLLNASVAGAIQKNASGGEDLRLAFFRGQADALKAAKLGVGLDLLNPSRVRVIAGVPGVANELAEAEDALLGVVDQANALQYRESLLAWTRLLAQSDLGTTAAGTTDMRDTHGNYGVLHDWFGEDARGVLKVDLWSNRPDRDPGVQQAQIRGANPRMVAALAHETPTSAKLPVEVDLHLDYDGRTQREFGTGEVSIDERGRPAYTGDEAADRWLALRHDGLISEHGADDLNTGVAPGVANEIVHKAVLAHTFADLGVESA